MRKIPTVWARDPADMSRLLEGEVNPACQWVLDGEGTATRKFDGTCVLIRRDGMAVHAFARREVKPGNPDPGGFMLVDVDEVTGKCVGWERAASSGYARWIGEALRLGGEAGQMFVPGTYELIGPKVQGNPEHADAHRLVEHDGRFAKVKARDYRMDTT